MSCQAARELIAATVWCLHENGGSNAAALERWRQWCEERCRKHPPVPGLAAAVRDARRTGRPGDEIAYLVGRLGLSPEDCARA